MNQHRSVAATKGQFKCFHCRSVIRSKDGSWQDFNSQQIFVCSGCTRSPAPKAPKTDFVNLKL